MEYDFTGEGDLGGDCPPEVVVTVDVALTTDDGALAEAGAVTLGVAEAGEVSFVYDLDAPSGTLDPEAYATRAYDDVTAWMVVRFEAGAIGGEIAGQGEWTDAPADTASDGGISAERFAIASF